MNIADLKDFDTDSDGDLSYAGVSETLSSSISVSFDPAANLHSEVMKSPSHETLTKSNHSTTDGKINSEEDIEVLSMMDEKSRTKLSNLGLVQEIKLSTEKERAQWTNCISPTAKFYLMAVGMPLFFALLYAIAIFFPPGAREKAPALLWSDGALETTGGKPKLCPVNRPNICSEGVAQIIMIAIARLTAFASYVMVGFVFVSKMHSTIHFLSSTIFSQTAPIENMHHLHTTMGMIYGVLAFVHTIAHLVRWGMRGELALLVKSRPGLSGVVGMLSMVVVIFSMTWAKRFKGKISFEARLTAHWCLTLLVFAMAFHTPRCRTIVCIFFFLWVADYLYTSFFRTHRLEIVEFTSLLTWRKWVPIALA